MKTNKQIQKVLIPRGTPLTRVTENGSQDIISTEEFNVEVHQVKMHHVYFFVNETLHKAPRYVVCLGLMLLFFFPSKGYTKEISTSVAVKCILGEARLEYVKYGYDSLLAVAEALRNRGTTKGVYGCNVDFSKEMNYIRLKKIDVMALKAWEESKYSSLVKGATYWENVNEFGEPYWVKSMQLTKTVNNHKFYKETK